jgi:hypothetical protein
LAALAGIGGVTVNFAGRWVDYLVVRRVGTLKAGVGTNLGSYTRHHNEQTQQKGKFLNHREDYLGLNEICRNDAQKSSNKNDLPQIYVTTYRCNGQLGL